MHKVSIVIPVYNSSRFLHQAFSSVVNNDNVGEIIFIEDGSVDNSMEICESIKEQHPSLVTLITHKNHANKGAAQSRNAGIMAARCEYVAFLDSDDYYLPVRFEKTFEIFDQYPDADGVYEAIGTHFYDEEGKNLHQIRMKDINAHQTPSPLTTLTRRVAPEKLFDELLTGKCGWFHFNGLTVKKSIFLKCGMLDQHMKLGEDTDIFFRMAIKCRLYPGQLEQPVAMRGVYSGNGTLSWYTSEERQKMDNFFNAYMWKKFFLMIKEEKFTTASSGFLINKRLDYYNDKIINMKIGPRRKLYKVFLLFCMLFNDFQIIRNYSFSKK